MSAHIQTVNRYLPLQPTTYKLIEYSIVKAEENSLFVLHQPYYFDQVDHLLQNGSQWYEVFREHYQSWYLEDGQEEYLAWQPAMGYHSADIATDYSSISEDSSSLSSQNSTLLKSDGMLAFGPVTIVNSFRLDRTLKADPDFHGDTYEWIMGYFDEAYLSARITSHFDMFLGRISRNWGVINEPGLLLSNNPYAFDHFGCSATGKRLKYSFYITRLNTIDGIDVQGEVIPEGETITSNRFWASQRLDIRWTPTFQMSFAEANIYGGPDQTWEAGYMNPVQFFYSTQRNQGIQSNTLWQISTWWQPRPGFTVAVDLLADDLIVNNNEDSDDRQRYPDRLGVLAKLSAADVFHPGTLLGLRYARIWNETYTSYRTFENYVYFEKGMGFPVNSFEGLKGSLTWLGTAPWILHSEIEVWQRGDNNLHDPFIDDINRFPLDPVTHGVTGQFSVSALTYHGFEAEAIWGLQITDDGFSTISWNSPSDHYFSVQILYRFHIGI